MDNFCDSVAMVDVLLPLTPDGKRVTSLAKQLCQTGLATNLLEEDGQADFEPMEADYNCLKNTYGHKGDEALMDVINEEVVEKVG